jgi:hypothetical protein
MTIDFLMTGIALMQNNASIPDIQNEKFTDALDETLWPAQYTVTIYNFKYDGTNINQVGDPTLFKNVTFTVTQNDTDTFPAIKHDKINVPGEMQDSDLGDPGQNLNSYFDLFPKNRMWTKVGSSLDARRQAESGAIAIGLITYLYFISKSYDPDESPGLQDVQLSQYVVTPTPGMAGTSATGYDYMYQAVYPASNPPSAEGEPAAEPPEGGETVIQYPASGGDGKAKVTEYVEISGIGSNTSGLEKNATLNRMMTKVRRLKRMAKEDYAVVVVNFAAREIILARVPLKEAASNP